MNPKELWYYKKGAQERQKQKDIRTLWIVNTWSEDEVTLDDVRKQPQNNSEDDTISRIHRYEQLREKVENQRN